MHLPRGRLSQRYPRAPSAPLPLQTAPGRLLVYTEMAALEALIAGLSSDGIFSLTVVGGFSQKAGVLLLPWLYDRKWTSLKKLRLPYQTGDDLGQCRFDDQNVTLALHELRLPRRTRLRSSPVVIGEWKMVLRLLAPGGRLLVPLSRLLIHSELYSICSDSTIAWNIKDVVIVGSTQAEAYYPLHDLCAVRTDGRTCRVCDHELKDQGGWRVYEARLQECAEMLARKGVELRCGGELATAA